MFIVGLTGGISTGKSTVASVIKECGIPLIDADQLARDVVEPNRPAWFMIRKEFGDGVLIEPDGPIDRKKLASIVYQDRERLRVLNRITHPQIKKEMIRLVLHYLLRGHQFIVMDVPLLYETGHLARFMAKVIVVKCTPQQQLERLMNRDGLSRLEAETRIDAQLPIDQKCKLADYVIDNSKSPEETRQQALNVIKDLKSSWIRFRMWLYTIGGAVSVGVTIFLIVHFLF